MWRLFIHSLFICESQNKKNNRKKTAEFLLYLYMNVHYLFCFRTENKFCQMLFNDAYGNSSRGARDTFCRAENFTKIRHLRFLWNCWLFVKVKREDLIMNKVTNFLGANIRSSKTRIKKNGLKGNLSAKISFRENSTHVKKRLKLYPNWQKSGKLFFWHLSSFLIDQVTYIIQKKNKKKPISIKNHYT